MLSDMSISELENAIDRIKHQILSLGPLRPGSLYEAYSVCGKRGCRCARKRSPIKHGPYHYLSYTFQGKSHTEFVAQSRIAEVRQQNRNYEKLMELVKLLIDTNIQLAKKRKEVK